MDVVAGKPGPSSDINLFRESQNYFDPNQRFNGDKAYVGEPSIRTPQKKRKKSELTVEKKQNKELAVERVVVEHLIRVVKIFLVAQERFRLNPRKYEQIIYTICGLVRLRIGALILPRQLSLFCQRKNNSNPLKNEDLLIVIDSSTYFCVETDSLLKLASHE